MPDTTYLGHPLGFHLPFCTQQNGKCYEIVDNEGTVLARYLKQANDAQYIVDACNEYQMIREAIAAELNDLKSNLEELVPVSQRVTSLTYHLMMEKIDERIAHYAS